MEKSIIDRCVRLIYADYLSDPVILPFADKYSKDTDLYRIMTTKPTEALKE